MAKVAELLDLGLSSRTVYARCKEGGPWQRLLPGVILLSNSSPSRDQLVEAAVRYAGVGAVVTGHDALRLQGIRSASTSEPPHLLLPHSRHVKGTPKLTIERTVRLPEPFWRSGFPVAPATRAALDAVRLMNKSDPVRALIAEVVQRERSTPDALCAELRVGSNRGSALPRRVMEEISAGVRSAAEAWARQLVLKSSLPEPLWNVPVFDEHGTLLGVVDAWWDEVAMAWEIDSFAFHLAPKGYRATTTRSSGLSAAGITVVHTVPQRLQQEPAQVLRELEQIYVHAQSRPRPAVWARNT
ncbi:hypothetical protein D5S17_18955 [Pseudonocardiaceae bacterium YIM PH 21723]|nr:hypothetical protein D5S17_18955 [Pseudonocardiaceae bacterium YIM PH 21723]